MGNGKMAHGFLRFVLLVALTFAPAFAMAAPDTGISSLQPLQVETATLLAKGEVAIDAGVVFEFDREVRAHEYDNVLLSPLGLRFGATEDLEVGAFLAFAANDGDDPGAPDDSGLEGITLFGKVKVNENAALRVGLTLAGDDDVFPHPNDGVDLFANLALQKHMETGLLYGEIGFRVQDGDRDDNRYMNYGVGFALPVTDSFGLNVELVGEEGHFGTGGENTLDLVAGFNLVAGEQLRLAPYGVIGLYDAGPDFAAGALLEMRF